MTRATFLRRKRSQPESAVVRDCIVWLWHQNVFCWRHNSGGYKSEQTGTWVRYGLAGSSDIIGLMPATSKRPGVFVGVEAKSAKGTLSEPQVKFKNEVESRGGIYILARSINDLEKHLKPLLNA